MDNFIKSIKGVHDCLPSNVLIWNHIKNVISTILNSYCFNEIKLPILEETRLFQRAIGKNTDVIEKEMYSFVDKNGKSLTLRPEGTIGCVRSIIEHSLLHTIKEQKLWYYGAMFRHEKPQKGRYRQFHQIGVEVFGLKDPEIELELIMLTKRFWKLLNISKYLVLEINTIGSVKERFTYEQSLRNFLKKNISYLDEESLVRLNNNTLRILDSKNIIIKELLKTAPILQSYLNNKSINNFEKFLKLMDYMGIKYIINQNLVRGLDYYNDIVFEWKSNALGTQNAICAGGRYDSLVKQLGGTDVPAVGFAIGIDRLLLLMTILKKSPSFINVIDVEIFFLEEDLKIEAIKLAEEVRTAFKKLKIQVDFLCGNIKKRFKRANKLNVSIVLIIGNTEINTKSVTIKVLKNNYQERVPRTKIIKKLSHLFEQKII